MRVQRPKEGVALISRASGETQHAEAKMQAQGNNSRCAMMAEAAQRLLRVERYLGFGKVNLPEKQRAKIIANVADAIAQVIESVSVSKPEERLRHLRRSERLFERALSRVDTAESLSPDEKQHLTAILKYYQDSPMGELEGIGTELLAKKVSNGETGTRLSIGSDKNVKRWIWEERVQACEYVILSCISFAIAGGCFIAGVFAKNMREFYNAIALATALAGNNAMLTAIKAGHDANVFSSILRRHHKFDDPGGPAKHDHLGHMKQAA